jgi:hypothetical protein
MFRVGNWRKGKVRGFIALQRPWTRVPVCEVCGKETAFSFSMVPNGEKVSWRFTGSCTSGIEHYYVEFDRCFRSIPALIDALAQLNEKNSFDPADFFRMLHRFRAATRSYNECKVGTVE